MKKSSNNLFATFSNIQLEKLTSIVNETIATGFNQPIIKKFTAADLWNIQRQGKNRIQRRYSL